MCVFARGFVCLSLCVCVCSSLPVRGRLNACVCACTCMCVQVWAGVLSSGPNGQVIRNTYQHKNDTSMHDDIGEALVSVCEGTPGGVLVFFPSYATMDQLEKRWQVRLCVCVCVALRACMCMQRYSKVLL